MECSQEIGRKETNTRNTTYLRGVILGNNSQRQKTIGSFWVLSLRRLLLLLGIRHNLEDVQWGASKGNDAVLRTRRNAISFIQLSHLAMRKSYKVVRLVAGRLSGAVVIIDEDVSAAETDRNVDVTGVNPDQSESGSCVFVVGLNSEGLSAFVAKRYT